VNRLNCAISRYLKNLNEISTLSFKTYKLSTDSSQYNGKYFGHRMKLAWDDITDDSFNFIATAQEVLRIINSSKYHLLTDSAKQAAYDLALQSIEPSPELLLGFLKDGKVNPNTPLNARTYPLGCDIKPNPNPKGNNLELVQLLLNDDRLDVNNDYDFHHGAGLITAATHGFTESFKLFLSSERVDISKRGRFGFTALITASSTATWKL
jgi:hypothetical protein